MKVTIPELQNLSIENKIIITDRLISTKSDKWLKNLLKDFKVPGRTKIAKEISYKLFPPHYTVWIRMSNQEKRAREIIIEKGRVKAINEILKYIPWNAILESVALGYYNHIIGGSHLGIDGYTIRVEVPDTNDWRKTEPMDDARNFVESVLHTIPAREQNS